MLAKTIDRFSKCELTGRSTDPIGFMSLGSIDTVSGQRPLYLSASAIRQEVQRDARYELVARERLEHAEDEIARLTQERDELRVRVEKLETTQEHIAGLVRSGFRVQKVMGRPPKDKS